MTDDGLRMEVPQTPPPHDEIAALLEQTGDYRILRRLTPRTHYDHTADEPTLIGVVVDTETTGLDTTQAEVIELGMVKFEYGRSGRVYRVLDTFCELQQPTVPIPAEVTRLTGISDDDVAGRSIDDAQVTRFVDAGAVVIAHNAKFDRPVCERRWPVFAGLNWACSLSQIAWKSEGYGGANLGHLLNDHGYFHDGHRAADDCHALLALLTMPLRTSGQPALAALLDTARKPTVRLWAEGSPYDSKDVLKARKYRWAASRRCWYADLDEHLLADEKAFLAQNVYCRDIPDLPTQRISARDRFSVRAGSD